MSSIRQERGTSQLPNPDFVHPEVVAPETTSGKVARYTTAVIRLSMGWIFLWAFLDKLFGLGHETASSASWINGGSPTKGFLSSSTGAFETMYHNMAGQAWADWLFMIALAGIGVGLLLGIGVRAAAAAGVILLVMMWSVVLPPMNNVFMDDHLIYALVMVLLAASYSGRTLGLGTYWERLPFVAKYHRWLA